jgi:hypothetical protein
VQSIEFRTVRSESGAGASADVVVPYLGGVSLIEWLRRVERPSASRDGQPDLAGSYLGLFDGSVRWPSRHYLGEPVISWFGDGDTVLLGCVCGEPGCWPFTALVTVDADVVTWSGYRTGHRDWDYSAMPELVFDRRQYEQALRATAR